MSKKLLAKRPGQLLVANVGTNPRSPEARGWIIDTSRNTAFPASVQSALRQGAWELPSRTPIPANIIYPPQPAKNTERIIPAAKPTAKKK